MESIGSMESDNEPANTASIDLSSLSGDTIEPPEKFKLIAKFMKDFGQIMAQNGSKQNKLFKRRKTKHNRIRNIKAHDDYFDESIMDVIIHKLANITMLTGLDISGNGPEIVFHSKVIGRCHSENGGPAKLLIHWEPEGFIPDEWILEKDFDEMSSRCVPLHSLLIDEI
uniref:AEBP2-like C-terminal SH3 domain-containing protein n=1 Tax=Tetranychus urticae TaxID=32264 RepID=T1JSZ4_TETUR